MQLIKPSEALENNREIILRLAAEHNTTNPRIFGSVVKGKDTINSDLDILIDAADKGRSTDYFDLMELERDLEKELCVKIDMNSAECLSDHFRDEVMEMAVPV